MHIYAKKSCVCAQLCADGGLNRKLKPGTKTAIH